MNREVKLGPSWRVKRLELDSGLNEALSCSMIGVGLSTFEHMAGYSEHRSISPSTLSRSYHFYSIINPLSFFNSFLQEDPVDTCGSPRPITTAAQAPEGCRFERTPSF